jgi:histone acetyltransferase MYST2
MNHGYGRFLIDFSYLLTRTEGKTGSPEKPLSDLGLISYRNYWSSVILNKISKLNSQTEISIKDLSNKTGIQMDDIVSTLQYMGLIKYWKGKHVFIKNEASDT